jgi:hypothetical protein
MNLCVKRLSVVLGGAGAVAHLVLIAVFVPDFEQSAAVYARIVFMTGLCFLIPFGLVYGTAWVINGCRQSRKDAASQATTRPGN